ncbi:copper chaperone CopZ [Peptococcaceae bacterium CEB3]|nr:copper chaperone CopZ [Peptococcaceae bacterium CEB3]
MFGLGRKAEKEQAGHRHMEHGAHAQAERGGHRMGASDSGSKTVLRVEGMTCMHCKMSVEKALASVHGVASASVDLTRKEAVISGSAARDALVKAVENAGYSVVA